MPYIGRDLNRGNYLKLDDISSSFNGNKKTFNLTSGGTAFIPGSSLSILVSVGGVILEPETAYQINNSEITFTTAPSGSDNFFCIALGVALGIGVPGNGTVSGTQMSKPFNYDNYFHLDSTNNRVGIGSLAPTQALDVSGTIKALNYSGPISNASGISTFYDLRVTNDLTVEGTTTTLDTVVTEVDKLEVAANNTTVGVAITQSGTGDILNLYDGSTEIVEVASSTNAVKITHTGGYGLQVKRGSKFLDLNGDWATSGNAALNAGDSGIRFYYGASSDGIQFNTGTGTDKVRITSAGKVGIGTEAPSAKLDVYVDNTDLSGIIQVTQDGTGDAAIDFQLKGTREYSLGIDNSDSDKFKLSGSAGLANNNLLTVTDSGNVGIGTDNPTSKLDVIGTVKADNINVADSILHTGNTNTKIAFTSNQIDLQCAGSSRAYINNYGLYIASGFPVAFLASSGATPNIKSGGTNANDLLFTTGTGNPTRMQITSSGKIGIGTASPDGQLHISSGTSGDCRVYIEADEDNNAEGDNPFIIFKNDGGIENASVWCGNADGGNDNSLNLSAATSNNGGIRFFTSSTDGGWETADERLRITHDGKVGINSSNPQAKLDVVGSFNVSNIVNIGGASPTSSENGQLNVFTTTSGGKVQFVHSAGFGGVRLAGTAGASGASLVFSNNYNSGTFSDHWTIQHSGSDDSLKLLSGGTGGTERLIIDSNGRVLIGHDSTPTAALSVAIVGSYGGSSTNTPFVYICRDEAATAISGGESLGQILFASNDGYRGAVIEGAAEGAWSGSSSDGYLVFKTTPDNATVPTEKLRITSAGKVGIGTDSPDEKLHVYNGAGDVTSFVEAIAGDALLNLSNSGNGNYSGINFIRERGSGQTGRNGGAIFMPSNTANNEAFLYIQAQSTSAQAGVTGALSANNGVRLKLHGDDGIFSIETGASERLRIDENGKVGIGTNNPSQLIDVFKTTNDAVIKTRTAAAGAYFEADSAATSAGYHGLSLSVSGTEKWFVGSYNSHNFHIKDGRRNDGAERFTIVDGTGKVGIGTNNPDELLHILSNTSNSKIVLESDNNAANNGIFWVDEGNNTQTEFYYSHPDNKQNLKVNGNGFEIYSKQTSSIIAKIGHGTGYNDMILSNGNFGIGTDDPAAKIEAFGNDAGIIVHNYGHSRGGIAGFTNQRVGFVATSNNDDLIFGYSNNPPSTANLVERMRIDNGTGKVGIMTSSPDSRLTVAGTSATAQIELKRLNSNASGTVGVLNFTTMDGHSVANISAIGDGDNEGAHLVFRTTSAAGENSPFGGSTLERLRITSDGEVGINSTTPDAQLDIFKFTNTSGSNGTTMLRLTNHVGSAAHNGDLHSPNGQQTFIDFRFLDGNVNYTPQVRIGAQIGNTEGDDGIESEGMGSFVVYTGKGTNNSGGGTLTEKLRVTSIGSLGLNNTNPKARVDFGYDSGQNSHAFVQFKGPNNKSGEMLHKYVFNGSTGDSQVVNLLEVTSWQSTNSRIFGVVKVMAVHPLSNHGNQHEGWFFKADDGSADTGNMAMVHSKGGSVGSLDWNGNTLRYNTPASSYLNMHISVEYHIYDGGTVVFDTSSRNF